MSHAYREIRGQSFRLTIDMELGEPIPGTFVHRGPADPAGTVYRAILDVEFENLFKFLFPTTKSHGQVLAARIEKCFGLTLATPTFHVAR